MFRSSNPALQPKAFQGAQSFGAGNTMTVQGTVNKSFILLFLVLMTASWVWGQVVRPAAPMFGESPAVAQSMAAVQGWMMLGVIGGFIAALVTIFKKDWAPVTAPIYALLEGLAIGGISGVFEMQYPGIVMQAVGLTFGTLFCMLAAYKSGLIKVTDKFRMGIVAATGAIALVYLVGWIMSFFGAQIPLIHESGPIGIGFSLVVVTIAALNLALDFDLIEQGASYGAPKYMEWYGAFGLMVTLIWLYLEFLRLLSKLNSRR